MIEAEVARDFAAVVEKIQQGAEIIVERNAQPVAVIRQPQFRGPSIGTITRRGADSNISGPQKIG